MSIHSRMSTFFLLIQATVFLPVASIGQYFIEDTLITQEISGLDIAFGNSGSIHMVYSTIATGDLIYGTFSEFMVPAISFSTVVNSPVQLIAPNIVSGTANLLVTYNYREPGNFSVIDGFFLHNESGDISELFTLAPLSGYMQNSRPSIVHISGDLFQAAWISTEGESSFYEEAVFSRQVDTDMSDIVGPVASAEDVTINSVSGLSHSTLAGVSLITWAENDNSLQGQIVMDNGILEGNPFEIHSDTNIAEIYFHKSISLHSGDFQVLWVEDSSSEWHLFTRRVSVSGVLLSDPIRLDPENCIFWNFDIDNNEEGQFLLVMATKYAWDMNVDLYGQQFSIDFEPLTEPYRITSTLSENDRWTPKVFINGDLIYTFWTENLKSWCNISSFSLPPVSINTHSTIAYSNKLIEAVYPNPSNGNIVISFNTPIAVETIVRIHNIRGKAVWHTSGSGSNITLWNGQSDLGHKLSSGIYLVSIEVNEVMEYHKFVLLK